jgi:hypothetical protein
MTHEQEAEVGRCIECDAPNSRKRVYDQFVCPFHFQQPQYRVLTKRQVQQRYQVDTRTLQAYVNNGLLQVFTVPNPLNHRFPPQHMFREWHVWQLFSARPAARNAEK